MSYDGIYFLKKSLRLLQKIWRSAWSLVRLDTNSGYDDLPDARRWEKKDTLFHWTIFILLLVLFTIVCWVGSYFIFWHPEKSLSYNILKKLKKLEPPQKFELTAAPKGEFLNPKALLQRYGPLTPRALEEVNAGLMRNFIRNYKETRDLVPYVTGTYNILDSFELTTNDFFPSGVVALTQSTDSPMVLLENVFTADHRVVPILHRTLLTGLNIRLEKRFDLSALVHVHRLPDGRMLFTTLPILYGSYASNHGPGSFSLLPPNALNISAGLPILSQARISAAEKTYIRYRQQTATEALSDKTKIGAAANKSSTPAASIAQSPNIREQLIRIEKPVDNVLPKTVVVHNSSTQKGRTKRFLTSAPQKSSKVPLVPPPPSSLEEVKVARALPAQATLTATPFPSQPKEVVEAQETKSLSVATPSPSPLPNVTPITTELPTSLASTSSSAPTASPSPSMPATVAFTNVASGNWQTYGAGQMPFGRLVELSDVPQFAEKGLTDERIYLKGNFLVTAARANRAVLRSQSSFRGNSSSKVRIIVEFPSNSKTPELGSTFSRNGQRPFLITDVRKAPGGMINVFVREITHD
ncbi:MAG: hypothetical protein C5B47_07885 [Verrucomicrobia bacterium]|nr:MAG: hypothetical protein C5B47_07885 [Verrucomicrobiota bacterium]